MYKTLIASAIALVFISGCASKGKTAADATAGTGSTVGGPSSNAAGANGLGAGKPITGAGKALAYDLSKKTVYFDFDSSEIKPDSQPVVDNFSRYLTTNTAKKVRLEGNTDERGSREYNLALSERRAQSVARALKAAGVGEQQLSTAAYGEERPADPGHDEAAWAKNRRVDIVE